MWFLHDGTGSSVLFVPWRTGLALLKPHTGYDLNMLLSCFRKKMPGADGRGGETIAFLFTWFAGPGFALRNMTNVR